MLCYKITLTDLSCRHSLQFRENTPLSHTNGSFREVLALKVSRFFSFIRPSFRLVFEAEGITIDFVIMNRHILLPVSDGAQNKHRLSKNDMQLTPTDTESEIKEGI
jgi:hypothetical protein